jgi:NADPH2:quinone reductase
MHAIQITATGGPEVMKWTELPTPEPGPGEILVRVEASGVNFIDVYFRTGAYKMPLPAILGVEAAGVVEKPGSGVTGFRQGDRVAWSDRIGGRGVGGSYATHVAVPAARAVTLPEGIDSQRAAAVMLQGMTAHYLIRSTIPLRPGQTCLVHAAAGGVGLLLCQMAKRAGARVIGTVSTEQKAALAREAGADEVILYTEQDFEAEARRMTGGRGVDVVYDSVGKTTFDKSLAALAPRGMLALFGQSSGPVAPFDPQVLNARGSLFLTRPTLAHYVATRDELVARATEVLSWVAKGELDVRVGATFPLRDAAEAHRALEGRETTGKVVLLP